VIKGATYNPDGDSLFFMKEFRMVTLFPKKIALAKALNTTDAWQTLDEIKDTINRTYENRDRIEPSTERRVRATALDIYRGLPRTNCRACGERTCLAFAAKLLMGEQRIGGCTPLLNPQHRRLRRAMFDIVVALGYELPDVSA